MQKLINCIQKNTVDNSHEIQKCIMNMICASSDPIPLHQDNLLTALNIDGEFLVLKLHYNDFEDEIKSEKIKYKISQSLSVIVMYEDDNGNSFHDITNFVDYMFNNSDEKQNVTFGIKSVEKLSEFPITILFSGILPINQLKITVGEEIYKLIKSDDEYFIPRFKKHRDDISQEINIPILPVLPMLDKELGNFQVRLVDLTNAKVISEFEVNEVLNKETVETYLLKLFYIYKVLIENQKTTK